MESELVDSSRPRHAISVDVEDWVNATILQETGRVLPPGSGVLRNSETLLDLFSSTGTRATWFFLGEVAERFPALVARVAAEGHELGVHGYHHHGLGALSRAEYRQSLERAKAAVESAGGAPATGYRAVDFGVNRATWWALDEVLDAGFLYDSSIFPAWAPRYGVRDAPVGSHWARTASGRELFEVPVSVWSLGPLRVPFAGGGWLRRMPFGLNRLLAGRVARQRPLVYYLHPCEIETVPELGPLPESLEERDVALVRRAYAKESRGREKGQERYSRLLAGGGFTSIIDAFDVRRVMEGRI